MKASILDLRYKMKEVLRALDRHETVEILYHGKLKGKIIPVIRTSKRKITDHPFFGMSQDSDKDVAEQVHELRKGRYSDI